MKYDLGGLRRSGLRDYHHNVFTGEISARVEGYYYRWTEADLRACEYTGLFGPLFDEKYIVDEAIQAAIRGVML